MSRKTVAVGFVGTVLDAGKASDRWNRWRPTVSLCQHGDLLIDRLELLHDRRALSLAEHLVSDIAHVSPETEVCLREVAIQNPWDFEEVYEKLQDFALAYPFDLDAENYLVHLTTGTHVAQICMFLLTESRYIPGRLLQTAPPRKREPGPGSYSIIDLDLSKYDRLAQRFETESENATSYLKGGVETRNADFNAMIERIERVAIRSGAPLLLLGPTGAGKSALARRIYDLKKARHVVSGRFIDINCATIKGEHAMSFLFGHRRGFAGMPTERRGVLREADKGVLFLDEIDELGLDEQAMILDAVEHGTFYPQGSDHEVTSSFQLIAGANKDLAVEVREGRFRADLLARLNLWTFKLPGLAERPEDIEPNLEVELRKLMSRGEDKIAFAANAWRRYVAFATDPASRWSGNFRDLSASATRLATLAPRGRITVGLVDEEIERLKTQWSAGESDSDFRLVADVMGEEAAAELDRLDVVQLAEVIRVCRRSASMSAAGKILFAASRTQRKTKNDSDRVKKLLERFGLEWTLIKGIEDAS